MSFNTSKIPLSSTGQFSDLILDYLDRKKELRPFYAYEPELAAFSGAIADRSALPINRDLLVKVLKKQYSMQAGETVRNNIDRLLQQNTFTVCTGHQLCLFTGPLYFIYKILSTINLAEALNDKYPDQHFVPVYWMAAEDHDFEEISSIHLFGKTLTWQNDLAGGPVGRMSTSPLKPLLDELQNILGDSETAGQLIALFRKAYLDHSTLAEATRYLVDQLFGIYGLVVIDGDDAELKSSFFEILRDDIKNKTNQPLVSEAISGLRQMGYNIQVNPRDINVFLMSDRERTRIEAAEGNLDHAPESYSPNVVLRPLYQQHILPNLAYIGGPGELAYWLEYKKMFDHHNILFPVLIPRNFAMIVDGRSAQQLQKLGLSITDLFSQEENLIKTFVAKTSGGELSLNLESESMSKLFAQIGAKAGRVDATLKGSVEAELQKSLQGLKNIESRLMRAEKQKQETAIGQVKKLKEKFFPSGSLQERYDNFAPYYLKHGESLIGDLKAAFDPFSPSMLILEEPVQK